MTTAIVTKFIGASNHRPSRIKATTLGWIAEGQKRPSVTISYPHELNTHAAHLSAAKALINKLGWAGAWHAGDTANGLVLVRQTIAALGSADLIVEK
jgi:hypothetical protein